MTSCQEAKNNKSKENEISPIDSTKLLSSKNIVDTLDLQNLITTKIDSILPTPDSTFFSNTDASTSVDFIINKYINSNFFVTKTIKVLETTSADHPEGVWDCHTRTEYGNIAIEERTCELQLEKIVEFKNYSFKEVCRIIKILFTKKSDNGEGWYEGEYIYGNGMCSLSIIEGNDKIMVTYGCSC